MFKFICRDCSKTKELSKSIIIIEDGKVKTKDAECVCGSQMIEIKKEFKGMPSLIRTEPTLKKK